MNTQNRDVLCAAEVGRMAELGRFGKEITVYGCAYLKDGRVNFRLSENARAIYHFAHAQMPDGIYPTSVQRHSMRLAVPAGMETEAAFQVKLELAKELRAAYPRAFFEALEALAAAPANNAAEPILKTMAEKASGRFDALELQLFAATLERAYQGKLVDRYTHHLFSEWLRSVWRQMEDDPVPAGQIKRTLYGFVQQTEGRFRVTMDAVEASVLADHAAQTLAGANVAPVLKCECWLAHFGQMPAARKTFKSLLLEKEGEDYFALLEEMHALAPAVDQKAFREALEALDAQETPLAVTDLRTYGRLWNVC